MSARNTVFLAGSSISGLTELKGASGPILDDYPAIAARLAEAGAPDLLAEPVVTRETANGATVAWYTALDGTAQRYVDLSPAAQEWARLRLERLLLASAGPALRATPDGSKLARAFSVASPRDIFVINGEPVLTNWGLVPESAAASPATFASHHASTIGMLAPAFPVPPFGAAQEDAFAAALSDASPAATDANVAEGDARRRRMREPPLPPAPPPPPVPALPPARGGRAWLAPLVATFIAAAVLIFLLLPGVLIYPATAVAADDGRLSASQSRLIAALEAREQELKALLGRDLCPKPPEPEPMSPMPETPPAAPPTEP